MIEIGIFISGCIFSAIAIYVMIRERIVKLETRQEAVEKRLDKGSETMDKLGESINTLNLTLVELKTVIELKK